jgi:hypothetical protein
MNISQLDVRVDPASSAPLITVNGVATINGTLTITVDQVAEGQSVSVINATSIVGSFSSVVVKHQGGSDCTNAELVQNGGSLVGLLYVFCNLRLCLVTPLTINSHLECNGPGETGTGLTKWQIALIVIGGALIACTLPHIHTHTRTPLLQPSHHYAAVVAGVLLWLGLRARSARRAARQAPHRTSDR